MSTATMTPATTPQSASSQARVFGGVARFARWSPLTTAALILLVIPVLLAILAPWITPYDPTLNQYSKLVQEPSAEHIMGTDKLGGTSTVGCCMGCG